jgi:CRISPR/Cas system CMR subunit Cmr6 (Cas7 group RAMP superfamily)
MPLNILHETKKALGGDGLRGLTSRSLKLDRFAEPDSKDDRQQTPRKDWFKKLVEMKAEAPESSTLAWLPPDAPVVHARLMGRLLVDLAGGVMENANLRLNRYGLPIIPGSAVKGCARRMALQALHDWTAAGTSRPDPGDACGPCCDNFESPAQMLAAIACVFGWVEQDWRSRQTKDGPFTSDFAWACGEDHETIWTEACQRLASRFGWRRSGSCPWKELPSFAGSVSFLPAMPNKDPGLELDVVTPHHTKYYQDPEMLEALDTEDPIPVYFPAVCSQKEGDYFSFALLPRRPASSTDLPNAKLWLAQGLELFGLGAKTNAGYGWFDASEAYQESIQSKLRAAQIQAETERAAAEEAARLRKETEDKQRRKAEEQAALAGLSPDEEADWRLAQLSPTQFDAKVRAFCKDPRRGGPTEEEKKAIVRALRGDQAAYWSQFKGKATKGELATVDQAIRALNKQLNGDKMP